MKEFRMAGSFGTPLRRLAAGVIASLSCATMDTALAQTSSTECPVAGVYSLVGRQPGAIGQYRGEAIVTAANAGCRMTWYPPNDSTGTGFYANGELTIYFTFANGAGGVVKYKRAANGEFHGVWWMNANPSAQGTETLTPR
jgi:hypothetical protein